LLRAVESFGRKKIDAGYWFAIQVVSLIIPADVANPRLEEALGFLKGPEFIPDDSQPARVEFNGSFHFRFSTPRTRVQVQAAPPKGL